MQSGLPERAVPLAFVGPPFRSDKLRRLVLRTEQRAAGHPPADRESMDVTGLLDEPLAIDAPPTRCGPSSGGDLREDHPAPHSWRSGT
ncbi:hypothetical protein ABZU76_18455 [Amycolatopsis sp. NPDC005232]|uniref:hypothetical protein n=1 Tax=Amycolatopsis sp. NPDC005232 TaxID=3157027 RepID=UPI0033B15749